MKKILMIFALFAALASPVSATTFPVDDASIAAYVQLPSASIDLASVVNVFHYVEDLNNSYILGTIEIPGIYPSNNVYIKTYVGADGWIVAYIPRDESMAKMIRWDDTAHKGICSTQLFPTKLDKAIEILSTATGIDYSTIESEIKYYDFEHPEATDIKVIMKGHFGGGFNLLIPDGINLYDASASVGANFGRFYYVLDGQYLINWEVDATIYGDIPLNLLEKGRTHNILIMTDNMNACTMSATILVYAKP